MLLTKTKKDIYNKLMDFWIQIENLLNQKFKCICLKNKLRNNAFDVQFKTTGSIKNCWRPINLNKMPRLNIECIP